MTQTTIDARPRTADRSTRFIQEDWGRRIFRVNREAFRSPEVLDDERRLIWDRSWLYLGHET